LPKKAHFTVFRSASEEARAKAEQECWDNEGGHMGSMAGGVVSTPGREMPNEAVPSDDANASSKEYYDE
jgi:hypothetical protein